MALPATAAASTRYAAPGGGTVPGCPQTTPCSLEYAIVAASPNDEVIVGPGTYNVSKTILATVPLDTRGESPKLEPRIVGTSGTTPLESFEKQTISDLAIESTDASFGTLFVVGNGSVFDHLELTAAGSNAVALRPGNNFTLTDSLLVANGSTSAALFLQGTEVGQAQLRNDTIVASGTESIGVGVYVTLPATTVTIHATNVIADAATDANAGGTAGSTGSISFDHSNLDTMTGAVSATNSQTTPPLFVSAATGNYHEASNSPTIDAGINDPANGETDLEGNPRSLPGSISCGGGNQAAITDIGAYEFMPIPPPCPAPRPPDTQITKAKIRGARQTARFSFVAVGTATGFLCELERPKRSPRRTVSFTSCSSPKLYKHLKRGRYIFKVKSIDGNLADPTPAFRKFRVK